MCRSPGAGLAANEVVHTQQLLLGSEPNAGGGVGGGAIPTKKLDLSLIAKAASSI